jgi:putative ABC transport system permease protein
MTLWSRLRFWLRAVLRRSRMEREMDAELRFHVEACAEDLMRNGVPRAGALRRARLEFGGIEQAKEECRGARGVDFVESLIQDLRFGLRMLRKSPSFTIAAVLTLALGIGANTTVFSIIDAVLLRPLPFRDSSRLVVVWERDSNRNRSRVAVGPANFVRWREENRVFTEMAAGTGWPANLNDGSNEPERVLVGVVSPNLFDMLGIQPVIGRSFAQDEERPEKGNVVLLTRGYWERRYGGDSKILGHTIRLGEYTATIIGVMPDRVNFPDTVDMWQPFVLTPQRRTWDGRYLTVIARLKLGITVAEAQANMDAVAANTRAEMPLFDAGWGASVLPLSEQIVQDVKRPLLVLLGAVFVVLLIACANIANMLLARASVRSREMAVRIALGASQGRVIRQLLTESMLLGLFGGAAGVLLAYWTLNPLLSMLPREVPRFRVIGTNAQVLGFSIAVSLATGIACGLSGALRAHSTAPQAAMNEGGRSFSSGARQHRVRDVLVVAEVATSLVLLAGAGLLINSFIRLVHVDPGFDPTHVLTMNVSLPGPKYCDKLARQTAYYEQALERIRAIPGVIAAGATSGLPLEGGGVTTFRADDRPAPKAGDEPMAFVRIVTEDYFRALRIPLLKGRWFERSEDRAEDAPKKVVINEVMAQKLWPDQDPIGKRVSFTWNGLCTPAGPVHADVSGVVGNVKLYSLSAPDRSSVMYLYIPQVPNLFMTFVVRTKGKPGSLAAIVRREIAGGDPDLPVANIRTMEDVVAAEVRQPRFTTLLLSGFGALALLLVAIGIYGVISYSVAQRTNEVGVRMALGGQQRDILWLVVGQGFRLVLVGVAVGLEMAVVFTRLMSTLLFNVRPGDPLTLLLGTAVLLTTAIIANVMPAWRAAKVDPMVALRYE